MKRLSDKNKNILLTAVSAILFLITLAIIWIVHRAVHFQMDDIWYATKLYDGQESPPIENIKDIFEAQVWHYFNWGGRSVTHFFLQITLLIGETFADIMNVIMTVITALLITLMATDFSGTKKNFAEKLISITVIMGMLHAFNPDWHLNMYWQSGSANYLHITVVILLFVWAYLHEVRENSNKIIAGSGNSEKVESSENGEKARGSEAAGKNSLVREIIFAVIMLPVGLFTGWSNENMGPTAFLLACVSMFLIKKKGGKICFWMIEGAVLTAIGSALCILAPGNSVRSAYIEKKSLKADLFLRLYGISKGAFEYLFIAFLTAMALLAVLIFILREKAGAEIYLTLGAAVISWGAMIMSPHYPDRAAYGTMVFLILAIIILTEKIIKAKKEMVYPFYVMGAFVWMRGMFLVLQFFAARNYWI